MVDKKSASMSNFDENASNNNGIASKMPPNPDDSSMTPLSLQPCRNEPTPTQNPMENIHTIY